MDDIGDASDNLAFKLSLEHGYFDDVVQLCHDHHVGILSLYASIAKVIDDDDGIQGASCSAVDVLSATMDTPNMPL